MIVLVIQEQFLQEEQSLEEQSLTSTSGPLPIVLGPLPIVLGWAKGPEKVLSRTLARTYRYKKWSTRLGPWGPVRAGSGPLGLCSGVCVKLSPLA